MTLEKRPISCPEVLNEAFDYDKPSSFSRGMRIDLGNFVLLIISGTASVDQNGQTVHVNDFDAQCERTFGNIAGLLTSEGASWKDIVKTTCYLSDMKNYDRFNRARNRFFAQNRLEFPPASTCVEAKLCRPDLLVEIEALAIVPKQ